MRKLGAINLPQGAETAYDKNLSVMLYRILRDMAEQINALIDEVQPVEYALQFDYVSASVEYTGEALPGAVTSAAVWRIKRKTTTGSDYVIEWADGNAAFDNVWDNRASLSYS